MHKLFCCVTFAACAAIASTAAAGELKLSIANGRATLIATDVPVRQILAEWARIGETKVVNGDRVVGPNLTLQLVDRPEREVLDAVLRTAAGYVAAPRSAGDARLSVYDRILILPTSQAPAFNPAAASTPTFVQPARPMPMPVPVPVQEDDDPVDQQPNVVPPGMPLPPGAQQVPQTQPAPGAPQTLPRPGMLPPPQPGTPNPYAPAPYTPTPNSPMVRPPGAPLPPGVKPPGGGGES
jgi:hypothetical protein